MFRRRSSTEPVTTAPDTDTDSTPPHCAVGGSGKFSHGVFNLVHQHWSMQAERAGGFNVHNVEAAEAFHKLCMTLPAHRVRHYSDRNVVHHSMQKYLLHHRLFCSLKEKIKPLNTPSRRVTRPGIGKPLARFFGNRSHPLLMGTDISVRAQQELLHPEIRLARVELLDLLCFKFKLPCCRSSYTKLCSLDWKFGQKLTSLNGEVFWATDSQYVAKGRRSRRDNLLLHGSVEVEGVPGLRNALCCQTICFIQLNGIHLVRHAGLPKDILKEVVADSLILALVRWFEPHPDATKRDSLHLPLCPEPFSINHALWRYAETPNVRSVLVNASTKEPCETFTNYRSMFGKTAEEQIRRLRSEQKAYYGFIKPSSIRSVAFMSAEYEMNTLIPSDTWLHTINVF